MWAACIWSVYGLYMVCIWSVYGLYMVCIWSVYGLYMVCIWSVYGLYMVCIWSVYGLYMVCIWSVYGLYVVCILTCSFIPSAMGRDSNVAESSSREHTELPSTSNTSSCMLSDNTPVINSSLP